MKNSRVRANDKDPRASESPEAVGGVLMQENYQAVNGVHLPTSSYMLADH
jgi:hypothetical protein